MGAVWVVTPSAGMEGDVNHLPPAPNAVAKGKFHPREGALRKRSSLSCVCTGKFTPTPGECWGP